MIPKLVLRYIICTLLVSVACFTYAFPQQALQYNINYHLLTQEDGLANRNVNAGLQDSRGFIWLGTKDGLNRYDGFSFQLLTKEKNKLQANNVVNICEDANSHIWVLYGLSGVNTVSGGKIDLIDEVSLQIVPFDKYFKSLPFRQDQVIAMAANKDHELFIYCNDGFVYLYTAQKFRRINTQPVYTQRGSHFVFINHATDSGIWLRYDCFVKKSGQVVYAPKYQDGYMVMNFEGEDRMMLMYMGVDRYLDYRNVKTIATGPGGEKDLTNTLPAEVKKKFYDIIKSDYYMVLRENMHGSSIIQDMNTGLYLYSNDRFITLLDSTECRKLPSLAATGAFYDQEGKLWLCTNVGVMIFKLSPNRFTHYLSSERHQLTGERTNYQTRGINADTLGNIFISATTGAYHIKESGSQRVIKKINEESYVTPMVRDGDNYYFGQEHLFEYNIKTGKQRIVFNVRGYNIIWNVYKLSKNKWWLCNQTDFFLVRDGVFYRIKDGQTGKELKNVWIHQFFKDRAGDTWAVGSKGLYKMKNDSSTLEHYGTRETDKRRVLPFDDIHCVYEDGEGNFWMATDGDGLYKWTRQEHKFLHFTIADGLNSNILYGILEDEYGFLWISSDNGLMRFNKSDFQVKTYTKKDGITNNEFNRQSYFKAADGRMYFGTVDGVNAFYPRDFIKDRKSFNAPLQVTYYAQFNAATNKLGESLPQYLKQKKIILKPGDNFFIIEFALLDYEFGKHKYAYKIEGIDNEWNYMETNRLRISSPPYGNYTLRIKAQNNEGEWSLNEISIPLIVITPFYKKISFLLICFFLVAAVVIFYVRYRVWYYRRSNLALENVINSRTRELKTSLEEKEVLIKEIHHRVKNNLQVISSLLQLQSRSVNDQVAKEALLEGHNRVLSIALIHQKLYQNEKLDTVEFTSFATELFAQVSSVLSVNIKNVKFVNEFPELLISVDIAVPLGLILNELMTNSFKYAFEGAEEPRIILKSKYENEYLVLEYADNGIGMPEGWSSHGVSSLGTKLISRLTKQLGGRVEFFNDNGAHCRFYFQVEYFS